MAIIPLMLSCELRICTRGAWHMRSISPAPRRCPMPRDSGACRIASRRDRTHVSSTALDGGDLAIHTCICATAPLRPRSMAAPGARSAGGAAMWHAGAASRAVRMSLRGDAWRRGAPCGYRWPVRTARWPQSSARTHVSSTAPHGGDLAIHTCICATAPLRPRSGGCTRRQVGRWRSAVACRSSKLRCAHAVARRCMAARIALWLQVAQRCGHGRVTARTALRRGFAVVRFAAARRGPLDLRTQRVANPQSHQRFMACSCAATVVHETPLLCVTRTAGRAAS